MDRFFLELKMNLSASARLLSVFSLLAGVPFALSAQSASRTSASPSADRPGRDPRQAIDEEYTKKILEYTTEKFFLSPLVDYLPASRTVPTPKVVLGDIAGAPTALMELAYRLAVDESPYIRHIRDNLITLITPIVEVDGRDRQVDIFNWHMKYPDRTWPNLVYWGKYVAHDNNRDAMGVTLKLTENVLNTYVDWKAQVLHDLHESVPYLYDNTIGDGPYNAWVDPLLTNEWHMIGWNNVQEMTRLGMPGVFAFGNFDTWSPGYLMFIAATHNGISRLYETFGNGGSAETLERTLSESQTSRTWYRQNPPLPRVKWSLRNNNNYEQTGVLVSLNYFATNKRLFLQNF